MSKGIQTLSTRHLLGTQTLSKSDATLILDLAEHFAKADHRVDFDCSFRKLVCANLFLEPSTRTKLSFEMACHRLGIKPLGFNAASSSLKKKETLLDTFRVVAAMNPDLMVIRSAENGFMEEAAKLADFPIINAGEGTAEHPTQALLDALTIRQRKGNLEGLNVAICGDITHSRVAMSNFHLLPKLGAEVTAFGPKIFMPGDLPQGIKKASTFEDALKGADVVMMLRIQFERLENAPVPDDYFGSYGLTPDRLTLLKKDGIVMHPGPMNREVEISSEVADDAKRSVILHQVKNGVAVRMAILDYLSRQLRTS